MDRKILERLTAASRNSLFSQGVVGDELLLTLSPAAIRQWVRDAADQRTIQEYIENRLKVGHPKGASMPLLTGLLDGPLAPPSGNILVVDRYQPRTSWDEVSADPGVLAETFHRTPGYPTSQAYGSCVCHGGGTAQHLRGGSSLNIRLSPSRRFLYVKTGQTGGYGPDEGRCFSDLQEVLFDHGYLTEAECPTGTDNFDESERYTDEQEELARTRRCPGSIWIEGGNQTRLNVALDLSRARILGRAAGLLVAVEVYENWARCFHLGIIRRHSEDERLLGGHALVLIGFVELEGQVWGLLANSWSASFASESPLGIPGVALVSVDYLKEIMYHGALVICQDAREFSEAEEVFRGSVTTPRPVPEWRRHVAAGLRKARAFPFSWFFALALPALVLPSPERQLAGLALALGLVAQGFFRLFPSSREYVRRLTDRPHRRARRWRRLAGTYIRSEWGATLRTLGSRWFVLFLVLAGSGFLLPEGARQVYGLLLGVALLSGAIVKLRRARGGLTGIDKPCVRMARSTRLLTND